MNASIVLRPGRTPLADWREVRNGAAITLDPSARIDVEAGRAALATVLAQNGLLPPLDLANQGPSVADLIEARGEVLPDGELRLFTTLKLASLAQGASGVRWELVEALAELLARDFLPAVPEGASDRMALSHLFAALTGAGEILYRGRIRPAADVLRDADMHPLSLNPRERSALLSGTALTVATALGALFVAERVFQSAIVATALSARASGQPDGALHPSVHRLQRQRGQADVATALHALAVSGEAETRAFDGANADRSAVFRAGAALDLLRQAAALLERAANSVAEDRLVLWQSEEMVSGAEDTTSVALAADLAAMALTTLGGLAAGRVGALAPANADPDGAAAKASSLAAESRERAGAPALDPTGFERLGPLVERTSEIVAIEFIEAVRLGGEIEGSLAEVVTLVREAAPVADEPAAITERDIRTVAELVRSGELAAAPGVALPAVVPIPAERARSR